MNRVLFLLIIIVAICLNQASVFAQFGMGPPQNPAFQGKKIINKLVLYNASEYDNKKSGEIIAAEKLKLESIEAARNEIMSTYSRECPVQTSIGSQDFVSLLSPLFKNDDGSADWEDGVLEYQAASAISISDSAKILCAMSNNRGMTDAIKMNQKKADDALNKIYQMQSEPYSKSRQAEYDREVNTFKATNYFKAGIFAEVFKDYENAIEAYTDAIDTYPGFSEAYFQRASVYRTRGENDNAIADYTQAIKYDGKEADYYIERGICYFEMKKMDLAMKDLNFTINAKPSDAALYSAYAARGNIYEQNKETQKALNDYSEAIKLNPNAVTIFFRIGLLNRKLKNYEESVKDFTKVIELDSSHADAYNERGWTYVHLGDKKKVLEDFKSAAKLGCQSARDFLDKKKIDWQ